MVRGLDRSPVFAQPSDCWDWLERLERKAAELGAVVFAWALMSNHAHLVLRTGPSGLARFMAGLNTGYARGFNLRHDRSGHLFENRYRSLLVGDESYLRTLVRYVHLNPLRAGRVASLDELARWPWTGHAALMGRAWHPFQAVDEVLSWFGRDPVEARRELLRWMDGSEGEAPENATAEPSAGVLPAEGSPLSRHDVAGAAPTSADGAWAQRRLLREAGWNAEVVLQRVCAELGAAPELVRSGDRSRVATMARSATAALAREVFGDPIARIARLLRISEGAASRCARRGAGFAWKLETAHRLREHAGTKDRSVADLS